MFGIANKVIRIKTLICTSLIVLVTSSFVISSNLCLSIAKTSVCNAYATEIKTGTYIHNTLSVYFEKNSKGEEHFESFMLSYNNPDTLIIDGIEYVLSDIKEGGNYDKQDYKGIFKHEGSNDIVIAFSEIKEALSTDKNEIELNISAEGLNIDKDKITLPVIRRDFKKTNHTMSVNKKYDFIVAPYSNTNFYFKPPKAGDYTLTLSGTNRAKYWIAYVTEKPFVRIVPEYHENFKTTKKLYLHTDKEYNFYFWHDHLYHDKFNTLLINTDEFEEKASLEIKYEEFISNSNDSNNHNQDSLSNIGYRSNTYLNNDDDDDDDSYEEFGFAKGDIRTSGKGATKADYVKTGSSTVRYDVSLISGNAIRAVVPATVKIGGKTYKVTSIAPKAFAEKKNLKSLTIGKNVKKIGSEAVSKCTKLKTIIVKSKVLTKKNVKNSLKGSSVNTIKAPKKKIDSYSELFTKANAGKKANVKAK